MIGSEAAGDGGAGATSLPAMLVERARRQPAGLALREKDLGRWKPYTWLDYGERVARMAAGLRGLGVERGDRVAIAANNRPEWVMADLAIQGIGAVTVGLHPAAPTEVVSASLVETGAVVLIAGDEEQVDKVVEILDRLPALRRVVIVDPRGVDVGAEKHLVALAELEASSSDTSLDDFARLVGDIEPSDPAIVVPAPRSGSGESGGPAHTVLSHRDLVGAALSGKGRFGVGPSDDVLSYLPICDPAERLVSVVDAVGSGYVVNFGEGGDSFTTDLREVQPSFFLGVPEVWQAMKSGVDGRMADASFLKRRAYGFWMARGAARAAGSTPSQGAPAGRRGLGWFLLYRSLRKKLGLAQVQTALSCGSPLAPEVLEFFWSMGVPLRETSTDAAGFPTVGGTASEPSSTSPSPSSSRPASPPPTSTPKGA